MNASTVLNRLNDLQSFSRTDLQALMNQGKPDTSPSIANHVIDQLLNAGKIVRVGRNRYTVSRSQKVYQYAYSTEALHLADEIITVHPYLDFRIFELTQLNEFVNHQIAHNILFVSIEGELEEDVFNTLWEDHHGAVLLKPDTNQLYRYMSDNMIVIEKLPTESPRGVIHFWESRLEKILVDIAVDKLISKVVYAGEYPTIFHDAIQKYVIDKSVMTRYARRRGALEKYKKFLEEDAQLSEEEFIL